MGKWGEFEDYKKWVLKFDFLLVFGLLVHSIIFLVINRAISPSEIIGSSIEIVRDRLFWRQIAEALVGVCGISFCIGNIFLVWMIIRSHKIVSLKMIFLYFATRVLLMGICTIPFGLFDLFFLEDYIFPIWGITGTMGVILLALIAAQAFYKREKM